jgi:hypothetical protein
MLLFTSILIVTHLTLHRAAQGYAILGRDVTLPHVPSHEPVERLVATA